MSGCVPASSLVLTETEGHELRWDLNEDKGGRWTRSTNVSVLFALVELIKHHVCVCCSRYLRLTLQSNHRRLLQRHKTVTIYIMKWLLMSVAVSCCVNLPYNSHLLVRRPDSSLTSLLVVPDLTYSSASTWDVQWLVQQTHRRPTKLHWYISSICQAADLDHPPSSSLVLTLLAAQSHKVMSPLSALTLTYRLARSAAPSSLRTRIQVHSPSLSHWALPTNRVWSLQHTEIFSSVVPHCWNDVITDSAASLLIVINRILSYHTDIRESHSVNLVHYCCSQKHDACWTVCSTASCLPAETKASLQCLTSCIYTSCISVTLS